MSMTQMMFVGLTTFGLSSIFFSAPAGGFLLPRPTLPSVRRAAVERSIRAGSTRRSRGGRYFGGGGSYGGGYRGGK